MSLVLSFITNACLGSYIRHHFPLASLDITLRFFSSLALYSWTPLLNAPHLPVLLKFKCSMFSAYLPLVFSSSFMTHKFFIFWQLPLMSLDRTLLGKLDSYIYLSFCFLYLVVKQYINLTSPKFKSCLFSFYLRRIS